MTFPRVFELLPFAMIPLSVSVSLCCNASLGDVSQGQSGKSGMVSFTQARQLLIDGDYQHAADAFRNLVADDKEGNAYAGLIFALAKQDLLPEAEQLIKQGKQRFSSNPNFMAAAASARYLHATVNPPKGDLYLAVAADLCERAIKAAPDNLIANQTWGLVYLRLHKPDHAALCFRRCLSVAETPENLTNLAHTLLVLDQRSREGRNLITKALNLNSAFYPAHIERAIILLNQGKSKHALAELKTIPDTEHTAQWSVVAGDAYCMLNDGADALAAWQNAVHLDPYNPDVYQHQSSYYLSHGDEEHAVAMLLRGLEMEPFNEDLQCHLLNIAKKTRNESLRKDIYREIRPSENKPLPDVEIDPSLSFK